MVLPDTPEPTIPTSYAEAMGHAVPCPRPGCGNTQPPYDAGRSREAMWVAFYCCADCGDVWREVWLPRLQGRTVTVAVVP